MLKNLVIVESPTKAKTIEKFLGKDYKVMSSRGHIRDLKEKGLGINVENGFEPIYEVPSEKKQDVAELKKAASEAETVWLASDEDREGEAIAWHLYEVLNLKPENTKRIVFHEITKPAILNAIANPRSIDINLVDAQQARRMLDRIVGFELSPVLWKKIKSDLSAGRVQSVAVRLIVEREKEIKKFVSEPYFRVTGNFTLGTSQPVKAELSHRLPNATDAKDFLSLCKSAVFKVSDVQVKPLKKSPAAPFTTSTLQQEAARKLGFTVKQTMALAQNLYEAGHITYMRTDSTNLSDLAIKAISAEITSEIGEKYLKVRHYHTKSKGAQEAHEAIRPTDISMRTLQLDTKGAKATEKRVHDMMCKLYALIWKRAIASQMADAEIERTTVEIQPSSAEYSRAEHFTASGEVIKFDGFLKVYIEGSDDDQAPEDDTNLLPAMKSGDVLTPVEITAVQRFTQQPPRYTEASLVKKMEELGIGRPSTYSSTISTIQERHYIERGEKPGTERELAIFTLKGGKISESTRVETTGAEKGKLIPTDTGIVVNEFLEEHFGDVVDYNFTANVEEMFDDIAEGNLKCGSVMTDFYGKFHPEVEKGLNLQLDRKVGEQYLGEEPGTGKPVMAKIGPYGPMVQIGASTDEEKPRYASLRPGQSIFSITLADALKLFDFPRTLGQYEGKDVVVAVGKWGPYVKHDGKFVSIPADMEPASLTLQQAQALIDQKRVADSQNLIKEFDEDADLKILNGRYGVYIHYKRDNYKIPKTVTDATSLTYEQAMEIVNSQESKPKKKTKKTK